MPYQRLASSSFFDNFFSYKNYIKVTITDPSIITFLNYYKHNLLKAKKKNKILYFERKRRK